MLSSVALWEEGICPWLATGVAGYMGGEGEEKKDSSPCALGKRDQGTTSSLTKTAGPSKGPGCFG